jgi:predicted RNase H-like HicB family nuclease
VDLRIADGEGLARDYTIAAARVARNVRGGRGHEDPFVVRLGKIGYVAAMSDNARAPMTTYTVSAHWDDEAEVFYSRSDLPGLHVEAATLDEFLALVSELAPVVLAENVPEATGPVMLRVDARRELTLVAA